MGETGWDSIIRRVRDGCGVEPYHVEPAALLYCADNRLILPLLEKGSVDLVLTDPPYEVGKAGWDALPEGSLLSCWSLTSGGMLVFWSAFDLSRIPSEIGMSPKNCIVWWKPNLPALWMWDRSRLASQWEPLFYFAKNGYEPSLRPTDVWAFNYPANTASERSHPTEKPLRLIRRALEVFLGAVVFDPFLGSGTTAVAAKQLGRRCIGIEIEEKYCAIARDRLRQEVLPLEPHDWQDENRESGSLFEGDA